MTKFSSNFDVLTVLLPQFSSFRRKKHKIFVTKKPIQKFFVLLFVIIYYVIDYWTCPDSQAEIVGKCEKEVKMIIVVGLNRKIYWN